MRNKATQLIVYIHWLTVILITLSFLTIEFRNVLGKHTVFHDFMKNAHFYVGFTILALVLVRIVIRHFAKFPATEPTIKSTAQRILSKAVHIFLYVWLLAMPLLGWAKMSASGATNFPFGLPALISPTSKNTAHLIENIHVYLAWVGLAVILLHAVAAIFNHYYLKNNVLRKMSLK